MLLQVIMFWRQKIQIFIEQLAMKVPEKEGEEYQDFHDDRAETVLYCRKKISWAL